MEMDDWNRTRSERTMNCAHCAKEYVLHEYQAYDSGIPYTAARWVRASAYNEFQKLNKEAESLKQRANDLAEERYLSKWLSIFDGKSKKTVWEILTESGKHYPALGTFYKHVRGESLGSYLKRQFRQDTAKALSLLGVTDAEIKQMWNDAKQKIDAAERIFH